MISRFPCDLWGSDEAGGGAVMTSRFPCDLCGSDEAGGGRS